VKRRTVKADEYDVVTGWRRVLVWRRGEVAGIKRRMRRRERREAQQELRREEN
jgi:hypothetical protein